MEEWRSIDPNGRYLISSHGRVISVSHKKHNPHIEVKDGITKLIMRQGKKRNGYRTVNLKAINKRDRLIHDLVCAAFIGVKPIGMQVDHIDRNKNNNHASNLRYVTLSENKLNNGRGNEMRYIAWGYKKWTVSRIFNSKRVGFGVYSDLEDAIKARDLLDQNGWVKE